MAIGPVCHLHFHGGNLLIVLGPVLNGGIVEGNHEIVRAMVSYRSYSVDMHEIGTLRYLH